MKQPNRQKYEDLFGLGGGDSGRYRQAGVCPLLRRRVGVQRIGTGGNEGEMYDIDMHITAN